MNKNAKRTLFWTPRVLCILFALFLSLFALDVFGEGGAAWHTLLALLIHLAPVFLVVIVLAIAWRWEWVGAVLFVGMAAFYLVQAWGRVQWSAFLVISLPLALIGLLFGLNWKFRHHLRHRSES